MLRTQLFVEWNRALSSKNILFWCGIILILPSIRFYSIKEGYLFFDSIAVFQETVSTIIPMLFPVLTIVILLPSFLQEQRNNFISYTRVRVPLNTYILSKFLINAILTGLVTFLLIFIPFIFIVYIEPHLGIIFYEPKDQNSYTPTYTFSQFLPYGEITYGLLYSLWVSINAILYSSISFMLLLILSNPFVALSIPFLFYHIFNFITGVLNIPMFSPLSTIFPFNLVQQPLWTVLVPFSVLLLISLGIFIFIKRKEWMI